ncbi:hypothetical protein ILUMI_22304 [Ignelater luminosus]|uniref:Uncharacterized protein n=1 Tax=Ignelater luminosus TaxID=2038154 RepID=A0A8K0G2Y1_IGNLU|nr:hypothetical protein ILUMI_22304 [Ignelater luminosus]
MTRETAWKILSPLATLAYKILPRKLRPQCLPRNNLDFLTINEIGNDALEAENINNLKNVLDFGIRQDFNFQAKGESNVAPNEGATGGPEVTELTNNTETLTQKLTPRRKPAEARSLRNDERRLVIEEFFDRLPKLGSQNKSRTLCSLQRHLVYELNFDECDLCVGYRTKNTEKAKYNVYILKKEKAQNEEELVKTSTNRVFTMDL